MGTKTTKKSAFFPGVCLPAAAAAKKKVDRGDYVVDGCSKLLSLQTCAFRKGPNWVARRIIQQMRTCIAAAFLYCVHKPKPQKYTFATHLTEMREKVAKYYIINVLM